MLPPKQTLLREGVKSPQTFTLGPSDAAGETPGLSASSLLQWMSCPLHCLGSNLKLSWSDLLDFITVPRLRGVKPKRFSLMFLLPEDFLDLLFQRKLDTTMSQTI